MPELPVIEGPSRTENVHTESQADKSVGNGQSKNPAIVVDFRRKPHDQNQRKDQGNDRDRHGYQAVQPRLELIGKLAVDIQDTEAAEAMEQDQPNQHRLQLQQAGDGPHQQKRQQAEAQIAACRKGHDRGLILLLPFLRIFDPGIDQGALGLHGKGDLYHAHPDHIDGHHAIICIAQQAAEQGCRKNGDSSEQYRAQDIKKYNTVLLFHGSLQEFRLLFHVPVESGRQKQMNDPLLFPMIGRG